MPAAPPSAWRSQRVEWYETANGVLQWFARVGSSEWAVGLVGIGFYVLFVDREEKEAFAAWPPCWMHASRPAPWPIPGWLVDAAERMDRRYPD